MLKNIVLLAIISGVSACASNPKGCKGVMGETKYLSSDSNSSAYKSIAQEVYQYAQMSSNTYEDNDEYFSFPKNIKLVESVDKGWGFQANIYEVYSGKEISEVVISYRGTEGLTDWIYGNLLSTQYKLADELFKEVKGKYKDTKIVATGHSLGGGLALHTSVVEDGVEAFVFNPSYRIHRNGSEKENRRVVIAETGEILKLQRAIWKNPKNMYYGDFYCTKTSNHSMFLLARCTTHVAAIENNRAQISLESNQTSQCNSKLAIKSTVSGSGV